MILVLVPMGLMLIGVAITTAALRLPSWRRLLTLGWVTQWSGLWLVLVTAAWRHELWRYWWVTIAMALSIVLHGLLAHQQVRRYQLLVELQLGLLKLQLSPLITREQLEAINRVSKQLKAEPLPVEEIMAAQMARHQRGGNA